MLKTLLERLKSIKSLILRNLSCENLLYIQVCGDPEEHLSTQSPIVAPLSPTPHQVGSAQGGCPHPPGVGERCGNRKRRRKRKIRFRNGKEAGRLERREKRKEGPTQKRRRGNQEATERDQPRTLDQLDARCEAMRYIKGIRPHDFTIDCATMKLLLSTGAALALVLGTCAATTPSTLRVHTVSWNSGHVSAPTNLGEFLGFKDGQQDPDVIAVAVQGYGFQSDKPQQGPACVKNFQNLITPKQYFKVKSTVTETMGLIVYCLQKHRDEATLQHQTVIGTMDDQKRSGGIVTSFTLYNKRFSFTTSRMSDDDVTSTNTKYAYDTTLDYSTGEKPADFLFWLGDLNVRVQMNATVAKDLVDKNQLDKLKEHDQLKKAQESKYFDGWKEPTVTFKPTYKFTANTDNYDLSATPSWTDRVLYKSGTGKTITPLSYNSLTNYKQTEHRPVLGMFTVTL